MKKKPVPTIVNWPQMGSGRLWTLKDPRRLGKVFHKGICAEFKDYEFLLRKAVYAIPHHELPMLVSMDLPDFLVEMIEHRLRKGGSHEGDSH